MSTRNLSGADRPSRSSSVRFRTCSISSRSLTRWLSCQRQSFHFSSGTSSQIGARRLTAGRPSGPSARAGSRRLTNGASAAARCGGLMGDRGLDLVGVHGGRPPGRRAARSPIGSAERIKSMQSASRRMIARGGIGGPETRSRNAGRPAGGESGALSADPADRRSGYSPITDQRKPIMMKKPVNSAIRPSPPYGELAPSWGTS